MSDLVPGKVSAFRREQGFGTITLDDGRPVPFDAAICQMVPEEGMPVLVEVGKAKWGGGIKAVVVKEASNAVVSAQLTLEQCIGLVQSHHLAAALTEEVLGGLLMRLGVPAAPEHVVSVLDAYYTADPSRAAHDHYVRTSGTRGDGLVAALQKALPLTALARLAHEAGDGATVDDIVLHANLALRAAEDPRRFYALDTRGGWHAFLALPRDTARALARAIQLRDVDKVP